MVVVVVLLMMMIISSLLVLPLLPVPLLFFPLSLLPLARSISSRILRESRLIVGGPADIGQLFIDHPHFGHMLLITLFLLLINVPVLELSDVVSVLLDVLLSLLSVFVQPKETFHLIEILLHLEVLEELQKQAHQWPQVWSVNCI